MTLPIEWVTILSEKNPQLPTLCELSHTATIHDVYDALEQIEFDKYLQIEQQKLEENQPKD